MIQETEIAVFGGGCFWCTEAVFKMLRGVVGVLPGYAGGTVPNPTYDAVCAGTTGHAEVIRVEYDSAKVKFEDLLTVFFATHDPTTLNRQGNDVGTQYRSAVFYTTPEQQRAAEEYVKTIEGAVTDIQPLDIFYEAENYHRDYYAKNTEQAYCQAIINPKLKKVKERFKELLNSNPLSS